MFKNKLTRKILAITLIFTLTFANFALVGKTYASTILEAVFADPESTGSKDVEFDAYLKTGDEANQKLIADVNDENLKVIFDLGVIGSGYVKDASVIISEAQENSGLNFKVKEELENENIESFEDNKFNLVKVKGEIEKIIEIPIEYDYEEFITLDKLSKDFKVTFIGTYVDSKDDKEVELEKEVTLNLTWNQKREFNVESNLNKFFEYESNGEKFSILQTLVKIDTTTENKLLPIENIETKITLPEIEGAEITNIAITPQSTQATNNKTNEQVIFDENNILVDDQTNTLTIKTINDIQTVVENNEDEILKESEEIVTAEKYFSGTGVDEYLITYTIKNLNVEQEEQIKQKIVTTITDYTAVETEKQNISKEIEGLYTISGVTGENISYELINETEKISKGNVYLNYNLENKNEIEFKTKSVINISNHEFVEQMNLVDSDIYYLQKDGTRLEANDVFYKNISVSKENFEKILGTEGKIEVLDVDGNLLKTIDLSIEPNEDYLTIELDGDLSKVVLKTTAPISEGNLNINITKVQTNSSYDKDTYKNLDTLNQTMKTEVKYKDVLEMVEVSNQTVATKLEDTTTTANLVLSKESFSTLVSNKDVEFKIELNNHKVESDIYGNSIFEIELPEYVTNTEITNASMVYGDGLEISNVELADKNGRDIIRINVNGQQVGLSSGIVTNGTNIVVNANIDIDQYAPAKKEEIKLNYYNEENTNYLETAEANSLGLISGVETKTIEYSAPVGVVSVNGISNYKGENSNIVSINQGTKKDKIEIYTTSKNAKMELIVMNNNQNPISDVSILGRIPFKGVKDIITGEEFGTTVDSKLLSHVIENANNNTKFNIYYSENGEATKDLNDASNGWNLNIENLDLVKSFLIVPQDENYVMDPTTILRFEYEYLIPENLEHNTDIYSTFVTYYTNNSEEGQNEEISAADIVYLTTGVGPQFNIETITDAQGAITEFEEFKITSKITNTGKDTAYDVKVQIPVPDKTSFVKATADENVVITNNEFYIEKIGVGQTLEFSINVKVNAYNEEEANKVEVYSNVQAKDLAKTIESKKILVELKQAEMKAEIISDRNDFDEILTEETEIELRLEVSNLRNVILNNVVATMDIDEAYEIERIYTEVVKNANIEEIDLDCFDKASGKINWEIGTLEEYNTSTLKIKLKLKALEDGLTKKKIVNKFTVKADGTEEYTSPEEIIIVGGASLEVKQTTTTTDTYIKEGNKINYTFTVKNIGTVNAEGVKLVDKIPTGLTVTNMDYTVNGIKTNKTVSRQDEATVYASIAPGDTLTLNLTAIANNIEQADELSVTNSATVTGKNVDTVTSNSITHIIEASEPEPEYESSNATASSDSNSNTNTNLTKTYKISGVAWLDTNEDGLRDEAEERLSSISAMLVDSDTGVIKSKLTTNSKGAYTFKNVENGNYLIIFDYDTSLYSVTGYQKEGVAANINSDVITTTIEQDGKQRTGAVTDVIVIDNGSVSNIDMGLVLADTFDLKLEKTISKLTVQNKTGTETIECNNSQIAKTEIAAKHLAGSTVYIEYTIKVSNVGELAGYAKQIVDYLPENVVFNSGLKGNENWYSGLDGNLYTSSLADVNIGPGESKEIKLIITKQMTEENTGLISNTAEIYQDYNIYGVTDKNSKAANKIQNENDMSTADVYIGVKTGEVFIYISVIITSILLGGIVIFIAYNKLIYSKRKGGV